MERWQGKVVLVTGASAGIGAAISKKLARSGMKVVGCGRNLTKLQSVADDINESGNGKMFAVRCDLNDEAEILDMFQKIREKHGALHALVNNAANAHPATLLNGTTSKWNSMMSLNVMAACICSREAVKLMDESGIDDGHIINMNSVYGHLLDDCADWHFYQITKFALKAMTEGLRQELVARKSHIRVTEISPGYTKTEFHHRMYPNDPATAESFQTLCEVLTADDIAENVAFILSCPPRVNICDIILRPTEQQK